MLSVVIDGLKLCCLGLEQLVFISAHLCIPHTKPPHPDDVAAASIITDRPA